MNDRADILRRRIAYYRRRLAEGVDLELAQECARQIIADEEELARLKADTDRRD
jgi:hypothetical protein